jgi:protein-disulfide isomerase
LLIDTAAARLVRSVASATVIAALAAATACAQQDAGAARAGASHSDLPPVLARIGGDSVTVEHLRERVGDDLARMEAQYLLSRSQLVQNTLDAIVRQRLIDAETRRTGKSMEDLLAEEGGGSFVASEVEVAAWYRENESRLGGRTLEQLRPQIAQYLRDLRRQAATQALEARLRQEHSVTVLFTPYRLSFDNSGSPALGDSTAPVTVVEFSDFQCPFCQQFAPTLKEIARNFGEKVHVVYRQFPIVSLHADAFNAAEGSLCAHEQGRFWQMHDLMFAEPNQLSNEQIKLKAGRLGLDRRAFDECLDSRRYRAQVEKDIEEGTRAGVGGTPAVFVNGQPLERGAVPYEVVAAAVERELARLEAEAAIP